MKTFSFRPSPPRRPPVPRLRCVITGGTGVLLLALLAGGARADENVPVVAVAQVTHEDVARELSIQAEFRAYQETDLHAKVAGYLQSIQVDIGDRVKAGDLLATLEVPELSAELAQAVAMEQRTAADYRDAHLNYTRLLSVSRSQPNLVAQQDLDAAEARDASAVAANAASKAEVEKFRTLDAYTRITAPFDGVVTRRFVDPGALIPAGTASNTQAMPLVRLSDNYRLRLDFPVSVSYAAEIREGDPVTIDLGDSAKVLTAPIVRFARRISSDTRTMMVEAEVANPDLKLIPGMYATVRLKVNRRPHALVVPVGAVSAGRQPTVYVVNQAQCIEEHPVQLGIETADKYEILSGLNEGEQVLIGARSLVRVGQKVLPKLVQIESTP